MGASIRLAPRFYLVLGNGLLTLLLLYFTSVRLPLVGFLLTALFPLPVVMVSRRLGLAWGSLVVATAAAIILSLGFMTALRADLLIFLQMAGAGLLLAWLDRGGYPPEIVVGATVLALTTLTGAFVIYQLATQGLTPQLYIQQTMQEVLKHLSTSLQQEGVTLQDLLPEGFDITSFSQLLARVSPALVIMNFTLVVWLNLLFSRSLLAATATVEVSSLSLWEAPGIMVFIFIGAGFLVLFPSPGIHTLGLNALLICSLAYYFQGLAVISFTLQRYQVPRFLRFISYPWLVLLKPVMFMVVVLGLTDLWLDYRRLHPPPPIEE